MISSVQSLVASEFDCLDDLMGEVFRCLLATEDSFTATKGSGKELLGVSLRLKNPRARLSRSEMRGKVFSGLGELFWYLSGSNRLDFISHYISAYTDSSDDGTTIHGAYGPRMFRPDGLNQIQNVLVLLQDKPTSRRAVIQLFSADDLREDYKDIPCTCTLQFILRKGVLNLIAYMRSNDAYWGLPHDIFAFTMLQEMMARALDVDVGFYQHMVGNLHLYDDKFLNAEKYLREGYLTIDPMPSMPKGDPWSGLPGILQEEASIRTDPRNPPTRRFDSYWEDIFRLLRIYSENHHEESGYESRIQTLKSQMCHNTYKVYFL